MGDQARVTSTDALEAFRTSLIIFLEKAHRAVDNVSDDVRRTRSWLQNDQRVFWTGELRRKTKALEQAQQELMSARLGAHNESAMMARQAAVNKAAREVSETEGKLRNLKKWNQHYDTSVDPYVKKLESLCQFLDVDLPKAGAYLANVQRTLDEYAQGPGPVTATGPVTTPPAETEQQPTL